MCPWALGSYLELACVNSQVEVAVEKAVFGTIDRCSAHKKV